MIIDEIREEIESVKKKIQAAIDKIKELTEFNKKLQSAFTNTITANNKIDELAKNILSANKEAFAKRHDDSGSNFEMYYLKNIEEILGDGHIDSAKQSISGVKQLISDKIGDTDTEIKSAEESKIDLETLLFGLVQKLESLLEGI